MPYAQVHYPFENRDWFEHHFPADFIVEYVAQTRGWFYTLMVLATALFDRPPFQNCICHGVIAGRDGAEAQQAAAQLPRARGGVPRRTARTRCAGTWSRRRCCAAASCASRRKASAIGDVVRNVLLPIWNAWYFFALYANTDGVARRRDRRRAPPCSTATCSRRRASWSCAMTERMDAYDLAGACQTVLDYLDALNNWYIRRSRARFWRSERDADKQAAYDTLCTVLVTLCRVASPLLPFLTEEIHRGLTGGESVHLADWPDAAALPDDAELVRAMDRVRDVCSTALGMRRQQNVRVRQPLATLIVAGPGAQRLAPYLELVRDEVNVKEVELSEEIEAFASFRLQLNSRALGPRLGGEMKKTLAAAKAGDWKRDAEGVTVAGQRLEPGEYTLLLEAKPGVACQALASGEMIAVLDFTLTQALVQEGLARDLVRMVQQARRDAGLHVSDRIRLSLALAAEAREAVRAFAAYVKEQTLASELDLDGALAGKDVFGLDAELGGAPVRVALARASV